MDIPTIKHEVLSKIHLIGGEKGGVGKSMVSRLLAQYFIDQQIPFIGFDTDRSHGALMRFYAGYASPVIVDRYEALDAIMEAAVEQPDRRILVDLAAQTHDPLVRWMDDSGVLDMADLSGIALHYWHVMDSGRDSVDLLSRLLDRFGQRLHDRDRVGVRVLDQPHRSLGADLQVGGEHAQVVGDAARAEGGVEGGDVAAVDVAA